MERLNTDHRATCSYCFGPLKAMVEGDVGHQLEFKVCDFCGAIFGPPWPEQQWPEPSSEPDDLYAVHVPNADTVEIDSSNIHEIGDLCYD